MTGVTKILKAHVKIKSFSVGYCKYEQKKYIVSYKTSVGYVLTGVCIIALYLCCFFY